LGFHVLFERLCEWDTLMPKDTSLPQKSHFAMCRTSLKILNYIMLKYNSRKQNKKQEFFEKKLFILYLCYNMQNYRVKVALHIWKKTRQSFYLYLKLSDIQKNC
jgi:hypothetical protein